MMSSSRTTATATTTTSTTEERTIPKFALSELTLGSKLGQGGFSMVLEVQNIQVDEVYNLSEEQTKAREEVASSARGGGGNNSGYHPQYAVKMLRDDLCDEEHSKGVIDLAVEARLLQKLVHPNIVTMRATANSDPHESRFFIILELLNSTLDDRITFWRREINKTLSIWCGPFGYCCANKAVLNRLWIDRMDVSRKLASAIAYLHSRKIIYRDLKPENIGFHENGQVKIFDFGLAKRLYEQDMLDNGLYRLTGNTGSLRYMAPEVALNQFYNLKADSYSFAMVFWQICSLQIPFAGYNVRTHADYVLGRGYRPRVERSWPYAWGALMRSCWDTNINERFHFDHIVDVLNAEYEKLNNGMSDNGNMDIKAKKKMKEVEATSLDTDTRKAFSDGEIAFLDKASEDKEIV